MMSRLTILFGVLLGLLGLAAYFGTGRENITALIPTFLGLPLIVLGVVAMAPSSRKMAMHVAVGLALLGFVGSLVRPVRTLIKGESLEFNAATTVQFLTATLCLVFVLMCVYSFVSARFGSKKESV